MRLANETRYETVAIRRLVLLGLKAVGVPSKNVRVRIAYNRRRDSSWHGGCASLGKSELVPVVPFPAGVAYMDPEDVAMVVAERAAGEHRYRTRFGRNMVLTLPRDPAKVDVGEFARTVVHEALHLRGIQHGEMTDAQRWCRGPAPAWSVGIAIVPRAEKPEPSPDEKRALLVAKLEARSAARLEKLRAKVEEWARREARAKKLLSRWRRKLAATERRQNVKMAAKAAASERSS